MGVKDIVAQLLERGTAMQTYWGFYITVSLGLIAFFGSAKRDVYIAALVSLVFVAFAYVNYSGMVHIEDQRHLIYDALSNVKATDFSPAAQPFELKFASNLAKLAQPDDASVVRAFHVGADITVLAAIWLLTFFLKDKDAKPIAATEKRPNPFFKRTHLRRSA